NICSFCATFIGSISAWLPSRRSTLHQMGACVMTLSGQVRSGTWIGVKGRYLRGSKLLVLAVPGCASWRGFRLPRARISATGGRGGQVPRGRDYRGALLAKDREICDARTLRLSDCLQFVKKLGIIAKHPRLDVHARRTAPRIPGPVVTTARPDPP